MVVMVRSDDTHCKKAVLPLNDADSALCTSVEREFLRELEGGCTAPIGALASIAANQLRLRAGLFALDGSEAILIDRGTDRNVVEGFGKRCAQEILQNGGEALMKAIRKDMVR
jgi:hydroxymethylbilane synthase